MKSLALRVWHVSQHSLDGELATLEPHSEVEWRVSVSPLGLVGGGQKLEGRLLGALVAGGLDSEWCVSGVSPKGKGERRRHRRGETESEWTTRSEHGKGLLRRRLEIKEIH